MQCMRPCAKEASPKKNGDEHIQYWEEHLNPSTQNKLMFLLRVRKSIGDFPVLHLFVNQKRFGPAQCLPCLVHATELTSWHLSIACSAKHVYTKMFKTGLVHDVHACFSCIWCEAKKNAWQHLCRRGLFWPRNRYPPFLRPSLWKDWQCFRL